MSALPWYKRDVDAWRGGTRSMSLELRGFYSELLDAMWDRQGPLPNDVEKLSMIVGCNPRTVRKLLPQLIAANKLLELPEGLMNRRMEKEIIANATKSIRAELEPNSKGIRAEFDAKIPKNLMFSTRALDLEEEEEKDFTSLSGRKGRSSSSVGSPTTNGVKCDRATFEQRAKSRGIQ